MLERAARCLDSRAPIPWHLGKKASRPRSRLQSSFWRHGAGDLDLPAVCLDPISRLFEPSSSRPSNRKGAPHHLQHDSHEFPIFLDFLYPPEAQAQIRRSALRGSRSSRQKGRPFTRNHSVPRSYASIARVANAERSFQPLEVDKLEPTSKSFDNTKSTRHGTTTHVTPPEFAELEDVLRNKSALLPEQLAARAWQVYISSPEQTIKERYRKEVIRVLLRSKRREDILRAAQLFKDLAASMRDKSTTTDAVQALLRCGEGIEAARLHDSAVSLEDPDRPLLNVSTDVLLGLFKLGHWRELIHSYAARRNSGAATWSEAEYYEWEALLGEEVYQTRGYTRLALSLLDCLSELPLRVEKGKRRGFVQTFLAPLFENNLDPRKQLEALEKLKTFDMTVVDLCAKACKSMLRQRSRRPNCLAWALKCSVMLREQGVKPSRTLMKQLMFAAVEDNDRAAVNQIESDWLKFYGPLDIPMSVRLMMWHSQNADVTACEKIVDQHRDQGSALLHRFFYPLLHAEALRIGPSAVEARMRWIELNFGLRPDLQFWNILLHAFARFGDIAGAQQIVDQMNDGDVAPDAYTFGTLLSICGRRGDSRLARSYLRQAAEHNVAMNKVILTNVVLAYINNGKINKAIAFVKQVTAKKPVEATRAWTQILAALATRKRTMDALRITAKMRALKVPFDGSAYAALMRAFTADGKPGLALRVMTELMIKAQVPYAAVHFAILMNGYADTGRIEHALRTYAQWLKVKSHKQLPDSVAIRTTLMKVQGQAARQQLTMGPKHPGVRAEVPEELLSEFLSDMVDSLFADKDPHLLLRSRYPAEALPSVFFDALFNIYGRSRAVEMTNRLFQMVKERTTEVRPAEGWQWPLQVIYEIMRVRLEMQDHASVQQLWKMAVEATLQRMRATQTLPELSTLEESEREKLAPAQLPEKAKMMLARHLDVFLNSMSQHAPTWSIPEQLSEFEKKGFRLDNYNWNNYVQILCAGGFIKQAFDLAEAKLMDSFSGYYPGSLRKIRGGSDASLTPAGAYRSVVDKGHLYVTYKTMAQLKDAYAELLRELDDGSPDEEVEPSDEDEADTADLFDEAALNPVELSAEQRQTLLRQMTRSAPRVVRAARQFPSSEQTRGRFNATKRSEGEDDEELTTEQEEEEEARELEEELVVVRR